MKLKLFKKIVSSVMAVTMMLTMVVGVMAAPSTIPDNTTARKLSIHKYLTDDLTQFDTPGNGLEATVDPSKAQPIDGIKFSVVKAYNAQEKAALISSGATENDFTAIKKADGNATGYFYKNTDKDANQIATDANGLAEKSFAADGSEDGVYCVIEHADPRVAISTKPFIVSMPLDHPTDDAWIYNVHVYPKNGSITLEKEINSSDNSYTVGDTISWKIKGMIPEGIDTAKAFSFKDTLDSKLTATIANLNAVVKVGSNIIDRSKYNVMVSGQEVTFDFYKSGGNDGRSELAKYIGQKVEITFDTTLNDTALAGSLQNGAELTFTNSNDVTSDTNVNTNDKPEVFFSAVAIDKYDSETNTRLAGAKFKIATSLANAKAGIFVQRNGNDYEVVTDAEGKAAFTGLKYDTTSGSKYYIVETEAPKDVNGKSYNLLKAPVEVTVNAGLTDFTLANGTKIEGISPINSIANNKGFILPITGGTGTLIFTVIGLAMMAGAGVLVVISRKKKVSSK